MKRAHASDYPELRRVFEGYLHEDFLEEHDSAAAALRAFEADANAGERRRFHADAARFLHATAALPFAEVGALLSQLGSRWTPASREELVAVLGRR
jgi:contact-dependent growth inhibition (CDI) system CdiI-like immunity protein